jgi:hypothetical protein
VGKVGATGQFLFWSFSAKNAKYATKHKIMFLYRVVACCCIDYSLFIWVRWGAFHNGSDVANVDFTGWIPFLSPKHLSGNQLYKIPRHKNLIPQQH